LNQENIFSEILSIKL